MKKTKSKLLTGVLILIIVCLLGSIVYIVSVINLNDKPTAATSLSPKKTKAANKTYRKLVTLESNVDNNNVGQPSPTAVLLAQNLSPTQAQSNQLAEETTVIPSTALSPTVSTLGVSPSIADLSLTPTETVLAYNSTSSDVSSSESANLSPTVSVVPTYVSTLPETGFINNALIIFSVSALAIFLAFIF